MVNDKGKRTTIAILQQTKDGLDSIKHSGQSYDGVIQDLIRFWNETKRDYWPRRKEQKRRVAKSAHSPAAVMGKS